MIYARRSYLFPDPTGPAKRQATHAERARFNSIALRPRARLVHHPVSGLVRALPLGWTLRGWRRACQRRSVHLGRAGSRS